MTLNDSLSELMGAETISTLSKETGIEDEKVRKVVKKSVPAILNGVKGKAASNDGLSGITDLFSSFTEGKLPDASSLLDSIFGNDISSVIESISGGSGVDASSVKSIITGILPKVLKSLGLGGSKNDITTLIDSFSDGEFDLSDAAVLLGGSGKKTGFLSKVLSGFFKK